MKVYLDDDRETPEGWQRVYTVEEAVRLLETRTVEALSVDNDLGLNQLEGHNVLTWLEAEIYFDETFPLPIITIHSANPTRVEHMQRALKSIERIRQQQLDNKLNNE
jgi:hypothetical protein